jgi:chorismate mutase
MGSLGRYRKKIDGIDRRIIRLLKSRFETAKMISDFKKSNKIRIADKKRELEVLGNIKKHSKDHGEFLTVIFKKIIGYSKKLQR